MLSRSVASTAALGGSHVTELMQSGRKSSALDWNTATTISGRQVGASDPMPKTSHMIKVAGHGEDRTVS